MPSYFKALATISAWFLFIVGWLTIAVPFIMGLVVGMVPEGPPEGIISLYQIGVASIILSVVAMKLRQTLE